MTAAYLKSLEETGERFTQLDRESLVKLRTLASGNVQARAALNMLLSFFRNTEHGDVRSRERFQYIKEVIG